MRYDFHLHSAFSEDSESPMQLMIEEGISRGLSTMCFTEHYDADFPDDEVSFSLDIEDYAAALRQMKEAYQDRIEILFGVELGMQPHLGAHYQEYTSLWPFDYVIASQHLADRMDPYYDAYWQTRSVHDGIALYFRETLDGLRAMQDFDTLGHLDYIVRYANRYGSDYSYAAYADLIDPILQLIIERDKCLEVNTAGFKAGLGHPNPTEDVLRRYRELGGEHIIVGSDGHMPMHLAWEFDRIDALLKEVGFTHHCIFRQRKRICLPL
ncbi:MAG: histidinol-phosphatase HisJ family protein [Eubacteriales bacterium]|nr:histidinol-phosphatase HisJ family protein [Eubacteriales bacterium]